MHKKSRKHSGVVLVYSLLKKTKKQKKKNRCRLSFYQFPFPSIRWGGGEEEEEEGEEEEEEGEEEEEEEGGGGGVENRSQVLCLVPRAWAWSLTRIQETKVVSS